MQLHNGKRALLSIISSIACLMATLMCCETDTVESFDSNAQQCQLQIAVSTENPDTKVLISIHHLEGGSHIGLIHHSSDGLDYGELPAPNIL